MNRFMKGGLKVLIGIAGVAAASWSALMLFIAAGILRLRRPSVA